MSAAAIDDYAVIGDCRAAALVSRAGSIDWLCWPRFDSPSLFGALLDDDAGRWQLAPTAPYEARRAYLPDTNVLSTTFHTDGGSVTVIDFMPVASEEDKRVELFADHEILRIVTCDSGSVEVEMRFLPRPFYGRPARLRACGALGLATECNGGVAILRSEMPLTVEAGGARGRLRLRAGDSIHSALVFSHDGPAVLPPLGLPSRRALVRTVDWWQKWAARVDYVGPGRDAVVRSALALKLMAYSPSGAVVAAPTTSLPERIGGPLNWDYRFCWLRDASLTVRALCGIGFIDEADAFVGWLVHSTRLTRPALNILYDVYGNLPPSERTLDRWRGYRGSRPVRIGNAAVKQLQLDVYGEVVDAAALLARAGKRFDRETQRMLVGFGEYVCRHWREADHGIWEPRSGVAAHTHSRLLCWTALDRLIELHERGVVRRCVSLQRFAATRADIRREIETRAWSDALGSYVSTLDGKEVDATLLLLAWYGFEDARSARMRGTWERIIERLGAGDGLVYRYRDGESPGEGAFGICGFWAAEYLALGGGSLDEAERQFAALVRHGNDLGLYAEETDPRNGAALGNFPQAFTHVGLINAALTLARRRRATVTAAAEAQP